MTNRSLWIRTVAYGLLVLVNLVHPLVHGMEGGGLDVWLDTVDAWAVASAGNTIVIPWRFHRG